MPLELNARATEGSFEIGSTRITCDVTGTTRTVRTREGFSPDIFSDNPLIKRFSNQLTGNEDSLCWYVNLNIRGTERREHCKMYFEHSWFIVRTTTPILAGRSTIPKTYYVAYCPDAVNNIGEAIANAVGLPQVAGEATLCEEQDTDHMHSLSLNSSVAEAQASLTQGVERLASMATQIRADARASEEDTNRTCRGCVFAAESFMVPQCRRRSLFNTSVSCRDGDTRRLRIDQSHVNYETAEALLLTGVPSRCQRCQTCVGGKLDITRCLDCIRQNFNSFTEIELSYFKGCWSYQKKK
jgi:hypothetical protein